MIVRWSSRRRGRGRRSPAPLLSADLIRPRGSGGGPRARFVAHLGDIVANEIGLPASGRRFWEEASRRLAMIALSPAERATAESTLAAVVPRPSELDEVGEATGAEHR
jgi:hypothetical protein